MKTMVLIALFLGFSLAQAQTQDCRLKTPVPLELGELGWKEFRNVRINQMPRADMWKKSLYINGALHMRLSKVWTATDAHMLPQNPTPYYSLSIQRDGNSLGFGQAQVYSGGYNIEGHLSQSGGEQVHTFISNDYGGARELFRMTVNAQNLITSLEIEIPWRVETPAGSDHYKFMGEHDKVCVLEMSN